MVAPSSMTSKIKELVKTVKENDWIEANRTKYLDYFRVREDLMIKEGLLLKRGTKFVPPKRNRGQVIREAHGLHLGLTRMKARLIEAFWCHSGGKISKTL